MIEEYELYPPLGPEDNYNTDDLDLDGAEELAKLLVKYLGAHFIPLHCFEPPYRKEKTSDRVWLIEKSRRILADFNKTRQQH